MAALAALLGAALVLGAILRGGERLVVYCAHDAVFAAEVLGDFERETGIEVEVRFDTEATKSLGLVDLIRAERARPRCDVLWNNEPLGTIELAADGLLVPYRGPGWLRIPEAFKDAEGRWVGFAARVRGWIVDAGRFEPSQAGVDRALAEPRPRFGIAKPLYGTTRAHATALWAEWGRDGWLAWHDGWLARGLRVVAGNAQVKSLVASGALDAGWTDSDDYFAARDLGAAVGFVPIRVGGRVLCLPNTVAIVAGTRRAAQARRLVDWLAGEPGELRLASGRARQVPLGPLDRAQGALPEEVERLRALLPDALPLARLASASEPCLAWLRSVYGR